MLYVRSLCCPTDADVDVVLSSITKMLFFFQAKGRIVVAPGNAFFLPSSVTGPVDLKPLLPSLLPWDALRE